MNDSRPQLLFLFFLNLKLGNETQRDGICSDSLKLVCLEVATGSELRTLIRRPYSRCFQPPFLVLARSRTPVFASAHPVGGSEKHRGWPEKLKEEQHGLGGLLSTFL